MLISEPWSLVFPADSPTWGSSSALPSSFLPSSSSSSPSHLVDEVDAAPAFVDTHSGGFVFDRSLSLSSSPATPSFSPLFDFFAPATDSGSSGLPLELNSNASGARGGDGGGGSGGHTIEVSSLQRLIMPSSTTSLFPQSSPSPSSSSSPSPSTSSASSSSSSLSPPSGTLKRRIREKFARCRVFYLIALRFFFPARVMFDADCD